MSGRENKREKREKFVRNSKDSCLKRVEENARERVLTAAPSGRRSSLLFPFRAYDTQRYIATPIATTHACIYTLYHLERIGKEGKKRVSKSERTFSNPSLTMGQRKTANCTFKFSFPLLPKLDARSFEADNPGSSFIKRRRRCRVEIRK